MNETRLQRMLHLARERRTIYEWLYPLEQKERIHVEDTEEKLSLLLTALDHAFDAIKEEL